MGVVMRHRIALLLVVALLFSLCAWSQSAPPQTQEPPKKKARKVWTNEDFGTSEAAEEPKEEAKAAEGPPQPAEVLFAELEQARASLAGWQSQLALYQRQLEKAEQLWRDAGNDYDRDNYGASVSAVVEKIAEAEQAIKELTARIAQLEQQTKGMKPPKKKEAAKDPNPQQLKEIPAEFVDPAAGPVPTKEGQPAPPPPPPPISF